MEQAYLDSPWSEKVLLETLRNPDTVMLVAEDDNGNAVGYGSFSKVIDEAHINNICVDNYARRKGVGCMILRELEHEATEKKCKEMLLEVAVDNLGAIGLYKKFGYSRLYIRPKYYGGVKDAVVMSKKITNYDII